MEETLLRLVDYYLRIIIISFIFCKSLVTIPTSLKSAAQKSPLVIIYYIEHMGTQRWNLIRYFSGGNRNKALAPVYVIKRIMTIQMKMN